MNLLNELLKEHSKVQTMRIVNHIGNDKEQFKELMILFLGNESLLAQRAAWVMSYCGTKHPGLIQPYFKRMVQKLTQQNIHDAIKRNTLRIWQDMILPESLTGEIYELCYNYLRSREEAAAIKVFAMQVMFNIVQKHPDLKEELKLMVEDMIPYGSAAIVSRGKKILKTLKNL